MRHYWLYTWAMIKVIIICEENVLLILIFSRHFHGILCWQFAGEMNIFIHKMRSQTISWLADCTFLHEKLHRWYSWETSQQIRFAAWFRWFFFHYNINYDKTVFIKFSFLSIFHINFYHCHTVCQITIQGVQWLWHTVNLRYTKPLYNNFQI